MSLEDIPAVFAEAVGINTTTAQVILSISVIFTILLPTILLAKEKGIALHILMFFLAVCLLVGLGWMPFWILIMLVAVTALVVSKIGVDGITGG